VCKSTKHPSQTLRPALRNTGQSKALRRFFRPICT